MDICHQQFLPPDEFAVFLPFDGANGNFAAFLNTQAIGLSGIHLGMGGAVAMKGAFADLGIDASRDEEGDVDVVVFQF